MCLLLDEAVDQWTSLVGREEAYRVQPSSSTSPQHDDDGYPSPSPSHHHSCPLVWREKICEWCFQVVDHCDIDRDVVSIAMSYFDRYFACHSSMAKSLFQLVAMTCLYIAIKIHSTRKISVDSMASLSKGHFRVDQILKMELLIIKSLSWHMNPPTPPTYLNIAQPLIDVSSDHCVQTSYDIVELSRYLLELSVCDGYFIDKSPSSVAHAAISVAIENFSESTSCKIKKRFDSYAELDNKSPQVTALCTERLRHVYSLAVGAQNNQEEDGRASGGSSPTSVDRA